MPKTVAPGQMPRSIMALNWLKDKSGLGWIRLEREIREKQYEAFGLIPPPVETVRGYFKGHRAIPFDPVLRRGGKSSPAWLMAANNQYQGMASIYFHPLLDLGYGIVESSLTWDRWDLGLEVGGFEALRVGYIQALGPCVGAYVAKLRRENLQSSIYKSRKRALRQWEVFDKLAFIHHCMLRLPNHVRDVLFHQEEPGIAFPWFRNETPISVQLEVLGRTRDIDGLAAHLGLVLEAAENSNAGRLAEASEATLTYLDFVDTDPLFDRVRTEIRACIEKACREVSLRHYPLVLPQDYWPLSWQVCLPRGLQTTSTGLAYTQPTWPPQFRATVLSKSLNAQSKYRTSLGSG